MKRTLRNLRVAADEIVAAAQRYEQQRAGLGAEFVQAIDVTAQRLKDHPEVGQPLSHDRLTRRLLVARFPFQVVYRVTQTEIIVVAIAHLKRRPGCWKRRS